MNKITYTVKRKFLLFTFRKLIHFLTLLVFLTFSTTRKDEENIFLNSASLFFPFQRLNTAEGETLF